MKQIFILAAATIALAACSNEDDNYVDEPVVAHISATIGESTVTRAADSSWNLNDEIGVTMEGRYTNIKYTTVAGDGVFAGTTMYFLNKREPVKLTAYYPFTGNEGVLPGTAGVIDVDTRGGNQTSEKQPMFDFLHAVKENVTGADPNVKFEFSHKMSKLTLTFKGGSGTDISKLLSYQIDGLIMYGTFDTASGICAVKNDAEAAPLTIELKEEAVKDDEILSSLILIPQPAARESVTLKIVDSDNQEYSCKLNFKENNLTEGNNYQWTITVNKTGLVVGNSKISDWNNANETPATADAGSVLPKDVE